MAKENENEKTVTINLSDLKELLAAARPSVDDQAAVMAKAAVLSRPEQPSNLRPPLMSALNPMGERDHPRPVLKCKFTMNDGIELERDQLSFEELDLLNALEAGRYAIPMLDGTSRQILVEAHLDSLGALNRINLKLEGLSDPDVRVNVPGLAVMLRAILGAKAAKILTLVDYRTLAENKPAAELAVA